MTASDELRTWAAERVPIVRNQIEKIADNIDAEFERVAKAVDATLGRGECKETMIDHFWRGCDTCGYVWEFMYGIGKCERPGYCPNCGARVVDE